MKSTIKSKTNENIGFGDITFGFAVYIGNRPMMSEYKSIKEIVALQAGDVAYIGKACGNGWRKIFNVYAKLLYSLNKNDFNFVSLAPTWQEYRDFHLLQENSETALIFSPPALEGSNTKVVHIICGRTYAKKLIDDRHLDTELTWLDDEFAIDLKQRVIVCPYFDYRQLSNKKIDRLSVMLSGLMSNIIEYE